MDEGACPLFRPDECTGTPDCPPRCPRYVTDEGRAYTVREVADPDADLELATPTDDTRERLASLLPTAADPGNPVDVLGDAPVERFADALDAALADPGVDAAVVVSTPHPLVDRAELARAVGDAARRHGVPVATCLSGSLDEAARDALAEAGVPNYPDATRTADALAALREYARWRHRARGEPSGPPFDADRVREAVESAADGRTTLGRAALDVVDALGIDTPAGGLAETPAAAGEMAAGMGSPVALNVASPELDHKSDVGGVAVGVDPAGVPERARELLSAVSAAAPEASVDGVVVQELVDVGVECVVGVTPHPRFGPVVTFGLGGVLVAGPDGATAVDLLCELDAEAPLGSRERTVEERGR